MIAATDAKKVLFSSAFPPDKIVDVVEGSFVAGASTTTTDSKSHTWGQTMFPQLSYSVDGGATWNDQGVMIPDLSTPSMPIFQTLNVIPYVTATSVCVIARNYRANTPTVTYRVALLWKD